EGGRAAQQAQRMAQVAEEILDPGGAAGVAAGFERGLAGAEAQAGVAGAAGALELLQVQVELAPQFGLGLAAAEQRTQAEAGHAEDCHGARLPRSPLAPRRRGGSNCAARARAGACRRG